MEHSASSERKPFTRGQMEAAIRDYNNAYLEHVKTAKIDERAPNPPIYIVDMLNQALHDMDRLREERDRAIEAANEMANHQH